MHLEERYQENLLMTAISIVSTLLTFFNNKDEASDLHDKNPNVDPESAETKEAPKERSKGLEIDRKTFLFVALIFWAIIIATGSAVGVVISRKKSTAAPNLAHNSAPIVALIL